MNDLQTFINQENDEFYKDLCEDYKDLRQEIKEKQERLKELEKTLIRRAGGYRMEHGVLVKKQERKGTIDYKKLSLIHI